MNSTFLPLALLALTATFQPPEAPKPIRSVKDNVLTSPEKPALRLKFDDAFKYAGVQTFILYGVANAEQHFFVDADEKKNIRRLYWVQFEGYLPTNTRTYRYQSKTIAKIGPLDFFADAAARDQNTKSRPDSDGAKAFAFLRDKGYPLKNVDVLTQRLVHLTDDKKRDELMIIYLEDLSPMNLTAADLSLGGKSADKWEPIAKELLHRALKGIELVTQ
jgi:hypothetical protein